MATIGILVFDGLEELDAVGPWEVLAAWTRQWPDDGWSVTTYRRGRRPGHVRQGAGAAGRALVGDAPPLDVLIQPGGAAPARS